MMTRFSLPRSFVRLRTTSVDKSQYFEFSHGSTDYITTILLLATFYGHFTIAFYKLSRQ